MILITPVVLPPTNLTYKIGSQIEEDLPEGLKESRLTGAQARRFYASWVLRSNPKDDIIYMGHGAPNAWVGDSLVVYMLTTGNADLLKDRVCVGLPCCSSGLKLGPTAVRKGARAFVGSRTTMYTAYQEEERNYQKDWFDYTLELYRALLLDRTSVGEAVERYKAKGRKYLELYKDHKEEWPKADWYITSTRKNIEYVMAYGDKSATLRLRHERERKNYALNVFYRIATSLSPTLALMAASVAAPLAKKGIEMAEKKMKEKKKASR